MEKVKTLEINAPTMPTGDSLKPLIAERDFLTFLQPSHKFDLRWEL